jgi:hypothetical protein
VIEITLARSRLLRSPLFRLLLAIPAVERKEPLLLEWTGYQKLRYGELGSPDVGFWEIYYLWGPESGNIVPSAFTLVLAKHSNPNRCHWPYRQTGNYVFGRKITSR